MWKKTEEEEPANVSTPSSVKAQPVREQAVIGPSLVVKGDVLGDEDLVIQGQVEGKVVLKNNGITVGKNGKVKADLFGKTISVEGTVQGNLNADERIVIRQSGTVKGNLRAPRVSLEDGAKFKGSIDMEGVPADVAAASSSAVSSGGDSEKDRRPLIQGELGSKVGQPSKT